MMFGFIAGVNRCFPIKHLCKSSFDKFRFRSPYWPKAASKMDVWLPFIAARVHAMVCICTEPARLYAENPPGGVIHPWWSPRQTHGVYFADRCKYLVCSFDSRYMLQYAPWRRSLEATKTWGSHWTCSIRPDLFRGWEWFGWGIAKVVNVYGVTQLPYILVVTDSWSATSVA